MKEEEPKQTETSSIVKSTETDEAPRKRNMSQTIDEAEIVMFDHALKTMAETQ